MKPRYIIITISLLIAGILITILGIWPVVFQLLFLAMIIIFVLFTLFLTVMLIAVSDSVMYKEERSQLKLLKNKDVSIREQAAKKLGEIGSYRYDEEIAKALVEEENPSVRKAIINTLLILSKKLIESAESAKDWDENPNNTHAPVLTLDYGPQHYLKAIREYIVPGLEKSLYSQDAEEREMALLALKQIGTPEARRAVEKALNISSSDIIQFSAYYPRKVYVDIPSGLLVYAHLESVKDSIEKDVQKFREELGGEVPEARMGKQTIQLDRGTPITIVPECEDIDFYPHFLTKNWDTDWVRFDFAFKANKNLLGDLLLVRVSIQVNGMEISNIKFPIDVLELHANAADLSSENPLRIAELSSYTAKMYQKIFISYSRNDKEIVEAYRLAHLAVGNDILMDRYSLRPGEDWRAGLARSINEAEIFQLFWSKNSAVSTHVSDEWKYALQYKCPETKCVDFIRPVYWINPIPAQPPNELSHLNFVYIPFKPLPPSTSGNGEPLTDTGQIVVMDE